ncbi:basic proline-rich protein-like [Panicum virgatum]|uniref:Late embryogenesis abundant protein LEA-2 subgroup domain-containing protein n=1 Tax=Panicum virgatum TaxID=38727 RepID=A0A8T0S510_PANVG|nr:basic proline-rich protein-like [Panicum virgatum]XP_039812177.1 basic proline-rich protein-like [Panicum virgatum]XP_039812178.1 basic proline-rich protein-like [Panicum virgatum]XP_039812179.1 basic proline-rich protein-like [Panicum virgatum]XP_039812180.1 basic proline-rich protein-like [Panicum virgatum]XP_039812182.1 basic proline-rich protein-like [Panicum virgatum]XP_039812183.1 basic proline-rich protein-like [Panicum virgatum]XP_039812184.1 basic proline-rich protein-like [Panic
MVQYIDDAKLPVTYHQLRYLIGWFSLVLALCRDMSKQPMSPEGGGGGVPLAPNRARGADAAPSPPGTGRTRKASVQGEGQAAAGSSLRDGAGTSAAMAAHGGGGRRVTLLVPPPDGGQPQQVAQYSREGRNGAASQPAAGRPRPSYVPPAQRRREQPPPAYGHGPYPWGGVPEERQQAAPPPGGALPPGTGSDLAIPGGAAPPTAGAAPPRRKRFGMAKTTWAADLPDPSDARQHRRPPNHAPGDEEAAPPGSLATPTPGGAAPPPPGGAAPPRRPKPFRIGTTTWASDRPADSSDARPPRPHQHTPGPGDEAAPPRGGSPTAPGGPRWFGRFGLPTAKTIERVSTLDTGYGTEVPAAAADSRLPPPHAHDARPQHPTPPYQPPPYDKKWHGQPSPMLPTERRRKKENSKKPLAFLFTLCCILFWLVVVCIGLAILVIYLLYHPKPPRLHVSTATLNAGYIDELPPPHLGQALNSDLYVLAAIYNPNTKIDVALHYMQFDLYFQGHLIGTQAVWPPLYERPGDSALRTVHLVVSEVVMRPEDADVWKNVTSSGGLVQMQLEGRFYVQLNFGRWLPFRYMVKPSCALWLDPPPEGALRRARCRQ